MYRYMYTCTCTCMASLLVYWIFLPRRDFPSGSSTLSRCRHVVENHDGSSPENGESCRHADRNAAVVLEFGLR